MYTEKFNDKYPWSLYGRSDFNDIRCFYCREKITNDIIPYGSQHDKKLSDTYRNHDKFCVQWISETEIFLHPHCAEEFAVHLIKDVRSGEKECK